LQLTGITIYAASCNWQVSLYTQLVATDRYHQILYSILSMCFENYFSIFYRRPCRIVRVFVIIEGTSLLKWQYFELLITVAVLEHQVYTLKVFVAFLRPCWWISRQYNLAHGHSVRSPFT